MNAQFAVAAKNAVKNASRTVHLLLVSLLPAVALAAGPFLFTPQGARYQDLVVGTGDSARSGDVVAVHFIGWLDDNGAKGKEIYNTRRAGKVVSFVLGTDRVMPGWNEGVTGMREGGKRLVMLPPALAFGDRRVDDIIPPHASLIFVIDLVRLEQQQ